VVTMAVEAGRRKDGGEAIEEVEGFGHAMVRNGHLLLGLIKEPDGVAGRVLESFGATLDGMRHEVLEFFAEIDEEGFSAA